MVDRARVVEAVNILIHSDRYAKVANELTTILETWDTRPMAYAVQLAPLNALLDVGLQSRDAFERLLKLVESKRKLLPKQRRVDYQRELMSQRRARITKAIDLEELVHGPLCTDEKDRFVRSVQGRWAEAKNKYIAAQGKLSWEQRNEATRKFWKSVDDRLDANINFERKRKRNTG
jgi:hypothetical protein